MQKKVLVNVYTVKYVIYDTCEDYLNIVAKNKQQASSKAKKYLEEHLTHDDWDIVDVIL